MSQGITVPGLAEALQRNRPPRQLARSPAYARPPPGVIAAEIVEGLEAALERMKLIAEDLTVEEEAS